MIGSAGIGKHDGSHPGPAGAERDDPLQTGRKTAPFPGSAVFLAAFLAAFLAGCRSYGGSYGGEGERA